MIYYDPATRKRPDFESIWQKAIESGNANRPYIACDCLSVYALVKREDIFDHWQRGHFDVYDEVKEK